MLDQAARLTFRHFSTLFLLVGIVSFSLHIVYAVLFNDVIAVSELHPDIAEFSEFRKVRNVGTDELLAYRLAGIALALIELALLPPLAKATGRLLSIEQAGGVATIRDAWPAVKDSEYRTLRMALRTGPLLTAGLFALLVGFLIERTGLLMADLMLSPDRLFAGVGLVQGLARASAAPFFLVTWDLCARRAKVAPPSTPTLY